MIKKPTVLILGAGASSPFHYPLGVELRNEICGELYPQKRRYQTLINTGFAHDEIKNFRDALYYSGKSSVDAFLEHRSEFVNIGKIAIAATLIPNESEPILFRNTEENWYMYLYKIMNSSFDEFGKNNISMLTFNYDRSIEHFLFLALKNSYGKNDKECAEKLRTIPILHLYGNLNDLPWQNEDGRPYNNETSDISALKKSASRIRIIHEDIEKDPTFQKAHEILNKAEKIIFLGFGYNQTNLNRLKIKDCFGKDIQGTCHGLPPAEISEVEKYFANGKHIAITLFGMSAISFLKDHSIL